MKRTYILFVALLALLSAPVISHAATIIVEVENYEFDPSSFTANVGDTIIWSWDEGFHTTTSYIIPGGAASWDQPINSGSTTFTYVPTVAGNYDYICSPHASIGMTGNFTVTGTTGINNPVSSPVKLINTYFENGHLNVKYSLPVSADTKIQLLDANGKLVQAESLPRQNMGVHSISIFAATLPKGIYLLSFETANTRITKKVVFN